MQHMGELLVFDARGARHRQFLRAFEIGEDRGRGSFRCNGSDVDNLPARPDDQQDVLRG